MEQVARVELLRERYKRIAIGCIAVEWMGNGTMILLAARVLGVWRGLRLLLLRVLTLMAVLAVLAVLRISMSSERVRL